MFKKNLNLFIIILGVLVAVLSSYIKVNENENMLLILGILIMLFGLFRISATLSSKTDENKAKFDDEEE